jgi:flagellar biosynthesis chaperone FliJ
MTDEKVKSAEEPTCHHANEARPSEHVAWCPDCGALKLRAGEWLIPDPFKLQAHEIEGLRSRLDDANEAADLAEQREKEARRTAEDWRQECNDTLAALERVRQERAGLANNRNEYSAKCFELGAQLKATQTRITELESQLAEVRERDAGARAEVDKVRNLWVGWQQLADDRAEVLAQLDPTGQGQRAVVLVTSALRADLSGTQAALKNLRSELAAEREKTAKALPLLRHLRSSIDKRLAWAAPLERGITGELLVECEKAFGVTPPVPAVAETAETPPASAPVERLTREEFKEACGEYLAGKGTGLLDGRGSTLDELEQRIATMQINHPIATSTNALAISGKDVMATLGIEPGPRVGAELRRLLDLVTETPELNTREQLIELLATQ